LGSFPGKEKKSNSRNDETSASQKEETSYLQIEEPSESQLQQKRWGEEHLFEGHVLLEHVLACVLPRTS